MHTFQCYTVDKWQNFFFFFLKFVNLRLNRNLWLHWFFGVLGSNTTVNCLWQIKPRQQNDCSSQPPKRRKKEINKKQQSQLKPICNMFSSDPAHILNTPTECIKFCKIPHMTQQMWNRIIGQKRSTVKLFMNCFNSNICFNINWLVYNAFT